VLSSASFSSGALSGTPTNVNFSVAHNDDNMNANAPIVAANSAICATIRAETTQPSRATEVEVIFSTSNNTAGAMAAKPPRAARFSSGCGIAGFRTDHSTAWGVTRSSVTRPGWD
jgi:hypothetical protein